MKLSKNLRSWNNGTCSTTVNITVNTPGSSSGCDTLSNIISTDVPTVYSTNNGYVSGWNEYLDVSKSKAKERNLLSQHLSYSI